MSQNTADRYDLLHARSLSDPAGFWGEVAEEISWFSAGTTCLTIRIRRLPGGSRAGCSTRATTPSTAMYRLVGVSSRQSSMTARSPIRCRRSPTGSRAIRSRASPAHSAASASSKGDRVIIYMPMIPQSLVAMLASARLGAVHSVVFGGFAPHELATRIDDAKPRVVVSASCGIEPNRLVKYKSMVDAAIEESQHKPEHCIIFQRPQEEAVLVPGRDIDWNDAVAVAIPADCVPVNATDPLYILYTSGTTGRPKGSVRDNGGHAVALKWTMKNFYNVEPGEVFWSASDVGWVVGHSYIVYAPLLHGCTTIVFEGKPVGTPNAGTFWRVIEQHKVPTLFTAPTAFRAIKREDPLAEYMKQYDLSHFRGLFLAGERPTPTPFTGPKRTSKSR